ncbi:MAG TPA: LemA family protein [Allosphingosinicella sp.]|nr:LemA family protein [Allosphingosinicella sp.]
MNTRLLTALVAPAAIVSLSGCGINSIPTAEEEVNARWADVQNQYQRRADLIPNLVRTVQGYATQEREVLTQVTEARANATRVQLTPEQLSDPQAMQRFAEAQARLSATIIPLQRLQENYPELRSNANFMALQSQLEGTENRIAIARQDYNRAVQAYNTRIRTFPDVIGAKVFYGAEPKVPFQATTPGAEGAPTVDFGTGR